MQATSAEVLLHNGTAEAPTTNFSFSSLDLFPVKLSFCVGLPSALSLTLLFAVAIYKKVDVAHPVFAVILQEIVSLCVIESVCLLSLLFLMADHFHAWCIFYAFAMIIAMQVHQTSWMVITLLRYYLIIYSHGSVDLVDLEHLRRRVLITVWMFQIPHMLLGVSTFLLGLVRIGWPEVKFFQLSPEDKLLIIFPLEVVINFPDLVSVLVYFLIWYKLWRKNKAVTPEFPMDQQDDRSVDSAGVPNNSEQSSNSGGGGEDHAVSAIMKTLGTHAMVSLLDAVTPLMILLGMPHRWLLFFMMNVYSAFAFWLPLLIVGTGFTNMGQMLKFYFDRIC